MKSPCDANPRQDGARGEGISTRRSTCRGVIPIATADSRTAASTPNPSQRAAQDGQQRVEH
jgi:hypothetical protein